MNLQEMRAALDKLINKATSILDAADGDANGRLTVEQRTEYDALAADIAELRGDIARAEQAAGWASEQARPVNRAIRPDPGNAPEDPAIGMNDTEIGRYSLRAAMHAAASQDWRGAGLELEASRATAQQLGREPQGFFVPFDWAAAPSAAMRAYKQAQQGGEQRDQTVGTPTAGGYTVATELGSLIELLRNAMMVRAAGARVLSGLSGNLAIPKQSGGASAYWVPENGVVTESASAFGQIALTPKTLGAQTEYSRRLLIQSSLDIEMFVRDDLTQTVAIEIDRVALHGSGAANQPRGIQYVAGIGAPSGAAADEAWPIDLETEVAIDNAAVGRLAYLTNATVRGTLKKTDIGTDTGMRVWDTRSGSTPLNGYPAYVTNQVSDLLGAGGDESGLFFGNWADLIIAFWSGLDVLVNPYANDTSGAVRITALQDCDVAVRHPQSFALSSVAL